MRICECKVQGGGERWQGDMQQPRESVAGLGSQQPHGSHSRPGVTAAPRDPRQVWGHSNPRTPQQVWGHSNPTGPTAGLGSPQPHGFHGRSVPTTSQGTASAPCDACSGQDHLPHGRSLSHLPTPGVRAWGEQPPPFPIRAPCPICPIPGISSFSWPGWRPR